MPLPLQIKLIFTDVLCSYLCWLLARPMITGMTPCVEVQLSASVVVYLPTVSLEVWL